MSALDPKPLAAEFETEEERAWRSATPAERQHLYDRISDAPARFDLFQAMRRLENTTRDKPRFGDALRPGDEAMRFNEEATLTFAVASISALERKHRPPRLLQRVMGFMGPNGALPFHLTEYARERQLHHGDRTFGAFLNMLLHRFGMFFYRAWARAQPVVSLDRPGDAAIVRHVGAFIGLAEPTQRGRDALAEFPKLHFAGRLARSARDADGLEAWIALHFGVPVRVEQYCGHWMPLADAERSRLMHDGQHGLGRGAVLGRAVWDVQHKFRIVIGPLPWHDFIALLPGVGRLEQLQAMVRSYVGFEFNWDLRLILKRGDVPSLRLGTTREIGRLGRTAWLNQYRKAIDAGELIMNVESIIRAPPLNGAAGAAHTLH